MGRMNMNPDEFAWAMSNSNGMTVVENTQTSGTLTDVAVNAMRDTRISKYQTDRDMYNEGQHTIQVKYDMVSNIVGDVCGVVKECISAYGKVVVEREKTKQVQAGAMAQIRAAEEQTEQVRIKETEETTRFQMECTKELEKARAELEKEQAVIAKDKEAILSSERKFDEAITTISGIINHIISQNEKYMQEYTYSNEIDQNNRQLIQLATKIVDLYIGVSR